MNLLEFDSCACAFELSFDFFSFFFGNAFFDGFGSAFDEVFSFFEAETGDSADFFDDSNFVVAKGFEDDVKIGFFFSSSGSTCSRSSNSSNSDGSSSADTEAFFESLDEFRKFENGHVLNIRDEFFHFVFF